MFSLYIKELKAFLSSIIGYIFIGVFLIVAGLFIWVFLHSMIFYSIICFIKL